MLRILNSRKLAVYLLSLFLLILILSSFLPSYYTLSEDKWAALERDRPALFWLASHFSTPFVVKSPVFLVLSGFLFLSTFVCTVTRVKKWQEQRESEFRKDTAFSFSIGKESSLDADAVKDRSYSLLAGKGWDYSVKKEQERVFVTGQKGIRLGFWGSVVFHSGLLLCFLAAPVTAISIFRGELILTEGASVPLREGFQSHSGKEPSTLPQVLVSIGDLKGVYEKGRYKVDFGGRMRIQGEAVRKDYPFRVNEPVDFMGYQFALHEFGFSPKVIIKDKGVTVFDYFLNLRNPEKGDYFDLGEGRKAFVLFFPDFIREGDRLGTKSKDPANPVLLVRLLDGDREIFKELLRPMEDKSVGRYTAGFPELRNWANFIVVRDLGIPVIIAGFVIGVSGLFVRFLSNERRIEMEITPSGTGTGLRINGYSRYYPSFLEKEVSAMAERITTV